MQNRGFTIIELVAVMVIVGVLAVFVAPRLNTAGFERYAFRHEVLSALRYAQKTAMASGCEVAVQFDAGSDRYAVFLRSNGNHSAECGTAPAPFDQPLRDPSGSGPYENDGGRGADLQTSGTVIFDGFGNRAGGPATIDLSGPFAIEIDDLTGYVHE